MFENILCTAPLVSVLVDTNKGIRPCCYYDAWKVGYLGNLKTESIINIFNNTEYKKLKQQMYSKEWPEGCLSCKKSEDETGTSLRNIFYTKNDVDFKDYAQENLTYIEFNGSNICNLSCLHCHPGFSSKWVIEKEKVLKFAKTLDHDSWEKINQFRAITSFDDDSKMQTTKMHLPNPQLIVDNLSQIDLTHIKKISFKGGEPLLNSETEAALEFLNGKDLLKNITVHVVTNGTYINENILHLLSQCKYVHYQISVDGVDELFNYIRYGDAKFNSIEPTIKKCNMLNNIDIRFNVAVMNYNAYNLLDIKLWIDQMSAKYNRVNGTDAFSIIVQSPEYLSVGTLSDNTRKELVEFYTNHNHTHDFDFVINKLLNDYSGHELHNKWVHYTEVMEKVRKNNILDIVPQLKNELQYF